MHKIKKYAIILLWWLLGLVTALFLLLLTLVVALQFPAFQTWLAGQASGIISRQTESHVSVERIGVRIPKTIHIRGLYVEDHQADTLLYLGVLRLDVRMTALLSNKVHIRHMEMSHVSVNLMREDPDTLFNLDRLLLALAGEKENQWGEIEKESGLSGQKEHGRREGFAKHEENEKEGSSTPWTFDIGSVWLKDIHFRYADHFDGSRLDLQVGALRTRVDLLDVTSQAYYLGDTHVAGLVVDMLSEEGSRPPKPLPVSPPDPPALGIRSLHLENPAIRYREAGAFWLDTELARLSLTGPEIDLASMRFFLESLGVEALDLAMEGQRFSGMDLEAREVFYAPDSISVHLEALSGSINGFALDQLTATAQTGPGGSSLEELTFQSGQSRLKASLSTSVPLLAMELPLAPHHSLDVHIFEALAGPDLVRLFPESQALWPHEDAPDIHLMLSAAGHLGELRLDTLNLTLPGTITAAASGDIKNLLEPDSLHLHIPRLSLEGFPASWLSYLPLDNPAAELDIHGHLSMEAAFRGGLSGFELSTGILSDMARFTGQFFYQEEPNQLPIYRFRLDVTSADPLAVIGQKALLENVSLSLQGEGKGFDPERMQAEALLRLDSMQFNGYKYKDLELSLSVRDALAGLRMDYRDEHLRFTADNEFLLSGEHPVLELDWKVEHLNAQALSFTEELIALQTNLTSRMEFRQDDFPDGWLRIDDTHVLLDREVFSLDSLLVNTSAGGGQYWIELNAPFINAAFHANVHPAALPEVLGRHLGGYLEEPAMAQENEPDRFRLHVELSPSPYLSELLLPQLSSYEPISMEAIFDAGQQDLMLDVSVPDMVVGGWHLQGLRILGESDPWYMEANLHLPQLEGHQLSLRDIELNAHLSDYILSFDISFSDQHHEPWLALHGDFVQEEDAGIIRFGDEMLLNRQPWQVPEGNQVRITPDNILVKDLRLVTDGKEFSLASKQFHEPSSPLEVTMRAIDLGLLDLVGDEPLVEGIFTGRLELWDLFASPAFVADLSVDGLGFRGEVLGDLDVLVEHPEPGLFKASANMSGYGNRVRLDGLYRQDEPAFMDFRLMLDKLEMSTVEALSMEQLTQMDGHISGELQLLGDPSHPAIRGSLAFREVSFLVSFLNASYRIPDERVVFEDNQIRFSSFTLLDRSERQASLDGHIDLQSLTDISFDLGLNSDNFLLMDLPRDQNELFFGRMFIDTRLSLRGDLAGPVVEGRIKLNQGSSISVIPPQTEPEAIGDEGVVEFITIGDDLFADLLLRPDEPEAMMSVFEKLDLSVNVEIDPQTEMRILLDEVAGDFLEIRGGGLISYGVDPGGRISLSGRYEISQGAYQMTFYDVIRRNFSIEGGSSIVWTGDPLDATVDIAAKYAVRTSVRELMASHAPAAGQQEAAFRQVYPFEVFLRMSGELMNPEISFEIALPPEHRGAMEGRLLARLNDLNSNESELNKQVFALLVLGSFIQDDPLAAVAAGPGITSTARNSASRILSQQLNRLSDRYIRGVDIRFDLESYEEMDNGQMRGRTELQMEVSRDFLDQRLRITAGGHLELEDETRRQVNPSDIAGDFSVEYLLDPDGRFTLKGFRERKFQDVFDNEVIETGLSLIFRQTFNDFRELFFKKEEEEKVTEP